MSRRWLCFAMEGFVATLVCTGSARAVSPPSDVSANVAAPAANAPSADAVEAAPGGGEAAGAAATAPESAAPVGAAVASTADDPYAEAKSRVARAEKLFEEGNYDAALTEFQRSYDTMDGHPARYVVLYNIGQCLEKLYRYDGAVAAYRGYLEQGGASGEDAPTVRAKVDLLEGLLGTLKLTVKGTRGMVRDFEVWVDGRFIAKNATTLSVPGGTHQVEVRAAGYTAEKAQIQLPARSEQSLAFSLEPLAAEYHGLHPGLFWTATGLAVASAITGGVFAVTASQERDSVNEQLDQGGAEALREVDANDKSDIEKHAVTADIFFASAGVFAVGAVALGFMTDFGGGERSEQGASSSAGLGVVATPRGGSISWGGRF